MYVTINLNHVGLKSKKIKMNGFFPSVRWTQLQSNVLIFSFSLIIPRVVNPMNYSKKTKFDFSIEQMDHPQTDQSGTNGNFNPE